MYNLLIKNQTNLSDNDFSSFLKKVSALKRLKHHKIADFNINDYINLNFEKIFIMLFLNGTCYHFML